MGLAARIGARRAPRVCPRRPLVEDGEVFPQTRPHGRRRGSRGSAACEEPFAFLGHGTAGCAGWRLAAGAAGDAGRWPRSGRAGLWQRARPGVLSGAHVEPVVPSSGTGIVPNGWGRICPSLEGRG